jgi:hypothetical protein
MNAFHDQDMARPTARLGQELADLPASEGFTRLSKHRQVLVFQTIQDALTANPPRPSATFENVVVAFTSLTHAVNAASCGQLNDAVLAKLESDVRISGGVIAPGLRCSGENSLASFRQATFGMLEQRFSPPVVDEIVAALNAYLRLQSLTDLGEVFQAISIFLSPVVPPTGTSPILELFNSFDNDRKALVFKTLSDAISAQPGRTAATFETIVTAYQCERSTLDNAAEGKFSDEQLKRLESSVTAAGGKLLPNIFAQGDHSIASFRTATLSSLETHLSPEVLPAVLNSLNQRLRIIKARSLDGLFKSVSSFLNPLLPGGWDTPILKNFKGLDPQRQALVFRTIDLLPAHNPDLDVEIFGSVVDAFCVERRTVEAATTGNLRLESLQELRTSIDKAGGVLASGVKASGGGSIGQFIEDCFETLQASISQEVYQAVLGALNAKLRVSKPDDIFALITAVQQFTEPLRQIDSTSSEPVSAARETATSGSTTMASPAMFSFPTPADTWEPEQHNPETLELARDQAATPYEIPAAMVAEPPAATELLADSLPPASTNGSSNYQFEAATATPLQPEEDAPIEHRQPQQTAISDVVIPSATASSDSDPVSELGVVDPFTSVNHEQVSPEDRVSHTPLVEPAPEAASSGFNVFSPITSTQQIPPDNQESNSRAELVELTELIELVKLEANSAENLNGSTGEEPSPQDTPVADGLDDGVEEELQKKTAHQMPS